MKTEERMSISMTGITKSFAGVKALDDINIRFEAGRVHGLIGANGAGKSTLIKILAGAHQPDSGTIAINGRETVIPDPYTAGQLGLSFIHQDLGLIQDFNVLENITLGLPKEKNLCFINWKATARKVASVIERIGFSEPLDTQVKRLSVANQWLVAIGRALYQDAGFIAMDEPTASLTETEVQMLFSVIRDLTAQGIGIIYVSHRLDEIIEICDEITVFKDGRHVLHAQTGTMTKQEIVDAIAGRRVEMPVQQTQTFIGRQEILKAEHLSDGSRVKDVSFALREGEILGITGLVGSGRTETALMIFGDRPVRGGSLTLHGKPYHPKRPADAVKAGIAIVPEERRTQGLCMTKDITFNINLPDLKATRSNAALPFTSRHKAEDISRSAVQALQVKTAGLHAPASSLSGGNQQKLVIGKWLHLKPEIYILDEPTRGVDVGARAEIYKEIKRICAENASFIVISSDVEELPGLCDRVLVMAEGRIVGELEGAAINKDALLRLCYAHQMQDGAAGAAAGKGPKAAAEREEQERGEE